MGQNRVQAPDPGGSARVKFRIPGGSARVDPQTRVGRIFLIPVLIPVGPFPDPAGPLLASGWAGISRPASMIAPIAPAPRPDRFHASFDRSPASSPAESAHSGVRLALGVPSSRRRSPRQPDVGAWRQHLWYRCTLVHVHAGQLPARYAGPLSLQFITDRLFPTG